ncbi:MAG: NADH-quinone oxidoreductase subunit I [Nitrospirae bacterium CG08_land_8_20_14_0_20_52_24]|nr:MAG: NADH-quinone oxidoreductase subunit I [Nitrospirae bacterium CG08_land_8_20_14_0_20_52_24]PIV83579.1 MAG: NADH-quinone oxidoreductase subunit I [Nitrospirae bacterium CG17_big_fil_post_rev_8_21_14_2_50_50_9]
MLQMLKQLKDTLLTSLAGMRITGRYLRPGTEVTHLYPETPAVAFERTRGRLNVDMDRCTACTLCAKACPIQCIDIVTERKIQGKGKRAARFVIDFSRCMFCGLCVEACSFSAIRHTGKCDFSSYVREELIVDFGLGFYTNEEKKRSEGVQLSATGCQEAHRGSE